MKPALLLAAMFTAAALALAVLPGCSDDPSGIDCSAGCDDCFTFTEDGECVCVDLIDHDDDPDTDPICPL